MNFRVKIKTESSAILVRMYQGRSLAGMLSGYWALSSKACPDDAQSLVNQFDLPPFPRTRVLYVGATRIKEDFRGLGLGKWMYRHLIQAGWSQQKKPFLFEPYHCHMGSGTSNAAKRVWNSIKREFPTAGMCWRYLTQSP